MLLIVLFLFDNVLCSWTILSARLKYNTQTLLLNSDKQNMFHTEKQHLRCLIS